MHGVLYGTADILPRSERRPSVGWPNRVTPVTLTRSPQRNARVHCHGYGASSTQRGYMGICSSFAQEQWYNQTSSYRPGDSTLLPRSPQQQVLLVNIMDHQHQAHVVTTMNRSMLNDLHSLGDQAAIRLGALLGSDHTAQKTLLASNIGLAVVFLYVCCKIFGYVTGPKMSRLPRAGKAPGWFGLGITAVKRDFKNNGRKILDEGYRKVCMCVLLLRGSGGAHKRSGSKLTDLGMTMF